MDSFLLYSLNPSMNLICQLAVIVNVHCLL